MDSFLATHLKSMDCYWPGHTLTCLKVQIYRLKMFCFLGNGLSLQMCKHTEWSISLVLISTLMIPSPWIDMDNFGPIDFSLALWIYSVDSLHAKL